MSKLAINLGNANIFTAPSYQHLCFKQPVFLPQKMRRYAKPAFAAAFIKKKKKKKSKTAIKISYSTKKPCSPMQIKNSVNLN